MREENIKKGKNALDGSTSILSNDNFSLIFLKLKTGKFLLHLNFDFSIDISHSFGTGKTVNKMEIQRIYEKTLNLRADEMYVKSMDEFLLEKLRAQYNNKCENSTYIKEVKSIVNKSMIELAKDQLDGSGRINVQFLADAVVYEEGSVIVGCKIEKIEKTESIACKYDNLIIFIKPNYRLRSLKYGDKIIIQVLNAGYAKEQQVVSINARMFFCPKELIIFKIKNTGQPLLAEQKQLIKEKLQAIKQVEVVKPADKKMWAYFSRLFYPFKEKPDPKIASKLTQKDIIDFANTILTDKFPKDDVLFLTRHPMIEKSEPSIYVMDEKSLIGAVQQADEGNFPLMDPNKTGPMQIIKKDMFSAVMEFLNDYHQYLKILQDILTVYGDNTKYKNLWKIYQDLKI